MRNLKRTKWIPLVVLIIVVIVVSLLAINHLQTSSSSTPSNTPQVSSSSTPSNASLNNAGYLEYRDQESKLFLVSANASYGVYSANATWSGGTFDNRDCFVITATIRNDYTNPERVYFAVSATLYAGSSKVSANDVTGAIIGSMSPPLGVPQWSIRCGETDTVEIYLATNNKNIDIYSINIIILELSGLPIP